MDGLGDHDPVSKHQDVKEITADYNPGNLGGCLAGIQLMKDVLCARSARRYY
jgi:hypothetical protein